MYVNKITEQYNLCDCCTRRVPTHSMYIRTRTNLVLPIDLCELCNQVLTDKEKEDVANYVDVRERVNFIGDL